MHTGSRLCPISLSEAGPASFCVSIWLAVTGPTCKLACRLVRLSYLKVPVRVLYALTLSLASPALTCNDDVDEFGICLVRSADHPLFLQYSCYCACNMFNFATCSVPDRVLSDI
jgi:hypothetical protein